MTALGGTVPKYKGFDDLSTAHKTFSRVYRTYVAVYNTYVQYLIEEKALLVEQDIEGLAELRRKAGAALAEANSQRDEVRTAWKELKTQYRRFNRNKTL